MYTSTYQGYLAFFDGSSWTAGAAAQGRYGSNLRVGVVKWYGNLRGKAISSVKMTITSSAAGNPATDTKTAYIYHSNYQEINTKVTGTAHRGSYIGSVSGKFYNNTITVDASCLKGMLANGENTICLYVSEDNQSGFSWSKNYFKWTAVTITVNWDDAPLTAPTLITPAHGSALTYYYAKKPTITWKGASGAIKYIVERATSTTTALDTWVAIGEQTGTSYTETLNLALGTYVRYRVKSVSASGQESAYITTGNIRRMLPNTAPTNVKAVVDGENVVLSWTGQKTSFAFYVVQYYNGTTWIGITNDDETTTIIPLDLLDASGDIKFRVCFVQNSVDSNDVIRSTYATSNTISKSRVINVKVKGIYQKGKVWIKIDGTQKESKKIFVRANGIWHESI